MTLTDHFDCALTDPDIITRSDRAPSDHERYGDWARKFFGYGFHQEYKDQDTAPAGLAATSGMPATRH